MQIHHLTKHTKTKKCSIPSQVLSLLSKPLHKKVKGSRIFYNIQTNNTLFCKSSNILKWEVDLGKQFSVSQWHKVVCANHRKQYQKLLTRWYFTPLRITKAYETHLLIAGPTTKHIWYLWNCIFLPILPHN